MFGTPPRSRTGPSDLEDRHASDTSEGLGSGAWARTRNIALTVRGDTISPHRNGAERENRTPISCLRNRRIAIIRPRHESWSTAWESNPVIVDLQSTAFPFGYRCMAEEARLELASQLRRRFSKAVAYQLAVLLLEEGGRVELPKRNESVWLFSKQLGLPMPKPSLVPASGIEPPSFPYEGNVLPLNDAGRIFVFLVDLVQQ